MARGQERSANGRIDAVRTTALRPAEAVVALMTAHKAGSVAGQDLDLSGPALEDVLPGRSRRPVVAGHRGDRVGSDPG